MKKKKKKTIRTLHEQLSQNLQLSTFVFKNQHYLLVSIAYLSSIHEVLSHYLTLID